MPNKFNVLAAQTTLLEVAVIAKFDCTVTIAVQLVEFPAASVIVNVTVLSPRLLQSKLDLLIDLVKEQLSDDPLSISVVRSVAFPAALRFNVKGLQRATGSVTSFNVIVKLVLCVFPFPSLAVMVINCVEL